MGHDGPATAARRRQDLLGELSVQPAAGCVGFGEPVGGNQQRGVFGDFLGYQGAEHGGLIQEETIVFRVSEAAVGAGVGGGIQGQKSRGGAKLLLAQLPVTDDLLRPAGDLRPGGLAEGERAGLLRQQAGDGERFPTSR
ncbi:hypothetical protein [Streptomyces sp. NBC_00328]|uniref:hypothetical protein n=1 Tax=Streptomyces sp. NBC_00328 TaxID=2903646 RepID=UPI002E2BB945|nr:hypothetical protein [Streptomyces sp. NBC_00328]